MSEETISAQVPASPEQARLYWCFATFLAWVGALGVVYVLNDIRKNSLYKKNAFKGFIPVFIGDAGWCLVYLPYHTYNAIGSTNNIGFDIGEDSRLCIASAFGATIATCLNLFGLVIVAYALYATVKRAYELKMASLQNVITTKFLFIGYVGAILLGVIWFSITLDSMVAYRSLYCAWDWDIKTGFILLAVVSTAMGFITYYCAKTYFLLKSVYADSIRDDSKPDHEIGHYVVRHPSASSGQLQASTVDQRAESLSQHNKRRNAAVVKGIIQLSVRFLFIFLLCWTPILISAVLVGIFKVDVPVQYDMFAGLMIKFKIPLDVALLLSLPAYRKSKQSSSFAITTLRSATVAESQTYFPSA